MSAPTIYKASDAGAPSFSQGLANPMINLLDAVLVNGYGSKPAAGWSKVYSATNKAVYRSAGTGLRHYLRIFNSSPYVANARAYQDMTGVDTGTDPYPTTGQVSGEGMSCGIQSNNGATTPAWVVVANEHFFHLSFDANKPASATLGGGWQSVGNIAYINSLMFGRFKSDVAGDLANSMIWGGTNQLLQGATLHDTSFANLYLAADASNVVKSIKAARHFGGTTEVMGGQAGYLYADPYTAALRLQSKTRILESSLGTVLWRGQMPGLALPLSDIRPLSCDILVGSGSLAGKSFFVLPVQQNSNFIGYYCYDTGDWGN